MIFLMINGKLASILFDKNKKIEKMKIDKTLVVKFGTSTLTQGSAKLNLPHMMDIVRQLAQLHQAGFRLVIVTSGAIAAGRSLFKSPAIATDDCLETIIGCSGTKSAHSNVGKIVCHL